MKRVYLVRITVRHTIDTKHWIVEDYDFSDTNLEYPDVEHHKGIELPELLQRVMLTHNFVKLEVNCEDACWND